MSAQESFIDFYEVLEISPNAHPDTVARVYRLLAQRFHPDNQETGDTERFTMILQAYKVLCDPELRAQFDEYLATVRQTSEIDRLSADRPKTGLFIERHAVNPVDDEPRPVPTSKRPSLRWSSIATRSAVRAGWFTGGVRFQIQLRCAVLN